MTAKFSNQSPFTNLVRTMKLPQYTQEEFEKRYLAYTNGKLLFDEAFPNISRNAKEFILTGATLDEWDKNMTEHSEELMPVITDRRDMTW